MGTRHLTTMLCGERSESATATGYTKGGMNMEWINVNDKLPATGEDVLVLVNAVPGKMRTAYRTLTGDWYDFGARADGATIEPTHWMPLPEPPRACSICSGTGEVRKTELTPGGRTMQVVDDCPNCMGYNAMLCGERSESATATG